MVILEIMIAILGLALGLVATVGLYFGLLGCLGVFFHLARCGHCGHLWVTSKSEPLVSCPSCTHPHLLHPLYAMHHHRVPVRQDSTASSLH